MDCRIIQVILAPFVGKFILIDKITNTAIGSVIRFDETEIYKVVMDYFHDDVQYRLEVVM